MTDLVVHPAEKPLEGSVPVPSDKSIGHRALLFGALAEGKTAIGGFSFSADNLSTADALRAMGIAVEKTGPAEAVVTGRGLFGLRAPPTPLDCGNSGTTMRMLLGILAAQDFDSRLVGDESLSARPMMRVAGPLRARGATIEGAPHPKKAGEITAPLAVRGLPAGRALQGIEFESPVASAQVKSALLLSGLYAHGTTYVKEPLLSRDHTERMLLALGVPLRTYGTIVELDPAGWDGKMQGFAIDVPGDPSAAAFLVAAGATVAGSRVTTRGVGVNPTRTGLFEILRDMGGGLHIEPQGERGGEPVALIHTWAEPLRAVAIAGEVVSRAIDEMPIACALAAAAHGTTTIRDASELRVKESDRIAKMIEVLRAFGVDCGEVADGLDVEGREGPLRPGSVTSGGDHRIAMTACVLALRASGPSRIANVDCIGTSFPKFVATLRSLGARIDLA